MFSARLENGTYEFSSACNQQDTFNIMHFLTIESSSVKRNKPGKHIFRKSKKFIVTEIDFYKNKYYISGSRMSSTKPFITIIRIQKLKVL